MHQEWEEHLIKYICSCTVPKYSFQVLEYFHVLLLHTVFPLHLKEKYGYVINVEYQIKVSEDDT